jgi:lipopolysaccharide transport system ATP-binding protein
MLNGLVKPDKGRITMRGRVGALIELGAGFNPILTARENIYVNGSVLGFSKSEIDQKFDAIVEFAEIEDFVDTPVQSFSSGMKVRLGFAVAAQMEPDVFLIDEVLAVGDAAFRTKCITSIAEIAKRSAVIFVSHSMPLISRMSDKALLLQRGRKASASYQVPDAINHYLSLNRRFWASVQGEENIQVIGRWVNSEEVKDPQRAIVVHQFEELSICLKFNFIDVPKQMILNIAFFDLEEKNVLETFSNYSNVYFYPKREIIDLELRIDKLRLNPGAYRVLAGFVEFKSNGKRGEVIYTNRGILNITVKGEIVGYAPVQDLFHWNIKCSANAVRDL